MYIILKNANFSDINIGNVDIPVVLSSWTNSIVSRYPNYSWDDSKKQALERFHISIVENDILDNIEYLAMPIFATTVSEAVQDALGSNVTIIIPSDASSRYDVSVGYGIARTGNVSTVDDVIRVSKPVRTDGTVFDTNCHFMAYPTEIVVDANAYGPTTDITENPDLSSEGFFAYMQTWGYGEGYYCLAVGVVMDISTTYGNSIMTRFWLEPGPSSISFDTAYSKLAEPVVACSYNNVGYLSQAEQDYITKEITKGTYYDASTHITSDFCVGLSPVIADDVWYARHFGFLSYGKYLTNEQNIKYQTALKNLVYSLG